MKTKTEILQFVKQNKKEIILKMIERAGRDTFPFLCSIIKSIMVCDYNADREIIYEKMGFDTIMLRSLGINRNRVKKYFPEYYRRKDYRMSGIVDSVWFDISLDRQQQIRIDFLNKILKEIEL